MNNCLHLCTCTTHSGVKKTQDWVVDQLTDLFLTTHNVYISHERFGRISDPTLHGNLHYSNDIDRSLNETVGDKIRKYHTDYNNNPSNAIFFIPVISSTSGKLHSDCDFVCLLCLPGHQETDRIFTPSGVQFGSRCINTVSTTRPSPVPLQPHGVLHPTEI